MLSKDELYKLTSLAKISLSEEETDVFEKRLSKILQHFKILNEIEKLDLKTTTRPKQIAGYERSDDIKEKTAILDQVLKNAPKSVGKAFGVPTVIKS